ncbi:hypothetical protein Ciccas_012674, partial [Cichlidogyrus casuarinus]
MSKGAKPEGRISSGGPLIMEEKDPFLLGYSNEHKNSFIYPGMYDHGIDDLGDPYLSRHPHMATAYGATGRTPFDNDPTLLLSLLKIAKLGSSKLRFDDDIVDRLNYQVTGVLLILLLTITGFRVYLSDMPFQCWSPQHFSRAWEEYAESYCWVANTYYVDYSKTIPLDRTNVLLYYQWAAILFVAQAVLFYLPCLIWRQLQNHSGFNVRLVMRTTCKLNGVPSNLLTKNLQGLAHYLDNSFRLRLGKRWRQKHLDYASFHSKKLIKQATKNTSFSTGDYMH